MHEALRALSSSSLLALLGACGGHTPITPEPPTPEVAETAREEGSPSSRAEAPPAEVTEQARPGSMPIEAAPDPQADSLPASCGDTLRVRRASQISLEAARAAGVLPAHLADCDIATAHCGERRWDQAVGEPPDRCAIEVSIASERYEVRIAPAARDGAPIGIEAWIGEEATGQPGRLDVTVTRWAVSSDGLVLVRGVPRQVSHTHGGEPAHIGYASYRVTSRSGTALPVRVTRAEWLDTGNERDVTAEPLTISTLAPNATTELEVGFASQSAYATWSERFATRITFDVGGRTLVATVEHHVFRRDPIRH